MVDGETSVVNGEQQHQAVHKTHLHSGGAVIAEGSETVLLGTKQLPMAGVDHMTTDKSAVATGEPSIWLGP